MTDLSSCKDFLKFYQERVEETWIESYNPTENLSRIVLGICGESGELAEKIKKYLRGDEKYSGQWGQPTLAGELEKEIGDVIYYLTMLCNYYGMDLKDVLINNLKKLSDRKSRKKIKGSGDHR